MKGTGLVWGALPTAVAEWTNKQQFQKPWFLIPVCKHWPFWQRIRTLCFYLCSVTFIGPGLLNVVLVVLRTMFTAREKAPLWGVYMCVEKARQLPVSFCFFFLLTKLSHSLRLFFCITEIQPLFVATMIVLNLLMGVCFKENITFPLIKLARETLWTFLLKNCWNKEFGHPLYVLLFVFLRFGLKKTKGQLWPVRATLKCYEITAFAECCTSCLSH